MAESTAGYQTMVQINKLNGDREALCQTTKTLDAQLRVFANKLKEFTSKEVFLIDISAIQKECCEGIEDSSLFF